MTSPQLPPRDDDLIGSQRRAWPDIPAHITPGSPTVPKGDVRWDHPEWRKNWDDRYDEYGYRVWSRRERVILYVLMGLGAVLVGVGLAAWAVHAWGW